MEIEVGMTLPNGAMVLAYEIGNPRGFVLARTRDDFVTWEFDPNNLANTYYGHYSGDDLRAAMDDYDKRVATLFSA